MSTLSGKPVLLGLGCNIEGPWGACDQAFKKAFCALEERGVKILARSENYLSPALGMGLQPDFLNCVISVHPASTPVELLRLLKSIEKAAGRPLRERWSSRPLDIDILDYRGRVVNWHENGATKRGSGLILPHPEMHSRAFVLKPLLDIAPEWHHPVLNVSARQLLRALSADARVTTKPA